MYERAGSHASRPTTLEEMGPQRPTPALSLFPTLSVTLPRRSEWIQSIQPSVFICFNRDTLGDKKQPRSARSDLDPPPRGASTSGASDGRDAIVSRNKEGRNFCGEDCSSCCTITREPEFKPGPKTMMDPATVTPFFFPNATDGMGKNNSLYDDEEYDYKDEHAELRQSLNIMSLIVYCLAFVLGVLGNGVVIWVTGFKMKKTINTVWFLNLAVADFLFTAFLPLSVTYTAMDFHWPFGKFMCKLNSAISFLNMFASVYILMVISVDRCISVVWPVWAQNYRSVRKASCVSLGVWALALVLSAPYFVFRDTGPSYNNEDIINCFNNFAFVDDDYDAPHVIELGLFRHQAMTITRFLLGFVVPFTVIVSCYAVIIHRLRRNRTLASHSSRPFKIIAAVITIFFLCWAPYHIMALIELVHHMSHPSSETLDHVITIGVPIATSLAFLNSCLNPLLYVFMGQDFKDKVRKSILNVLESAFQEEVSRSYTYTNSMMTSRSKDKSVSDAEV
ncbi:chemerin-like receptor 1 isoform X1 [Synchiropus splendidus]|uniref:chemerin-like receptor 1 isoform X1 n=2 Tax=Synchiropus splendidus TaxID=270530 RepID=UPI00237DF363|nr:chemerin-like receptor 1 isoform X1 [Synchiropus splendidus]XP_053743317.1 chemerin-like receptor 1 isoform X1 [Synchiropus splendidus]XP_053743318.1 chemerin-like receptor 1 isoform X1 [Synchiropus splendidus]XP_053743319.1 chemerin-like receptor 1 isoform X1 [Synchiropus splendidus]XP_053743320.1 chemerin-like receptor 1 isoform X1 [Synchiropus splendidus]XP_053743321.1 chemerin-like receptor 1 isoform X1 [Synchiropus splendidus]XP_053743322.1 chemerin-like receptor 1 isoform X1 [Synchir